MLKIVIVWHFRWYYVTLETDTLGGFFEVAPLTVTAATLAIGLNNWARRRLKAGIK